MPKFHVTPSQTSRPTVPVRILQAICAGKVCGLGTRLGCASGYLLVMLYLWDNVCVCVRACATSFKNQHYPTVCPTVRWIYVLCFHRSLINRPPKKPSQGKFVEYSHCLGSLIVLRSGHVRVSLRVGGGGELHRNVCAPYPYRSIACMDLTLTHPHHIEHHTLAPFLDILVNEALLNVLESNAELVIS